MDKKTIKRIAREITLSWAKERETNPFEDYAQRIPKSKKEIA